MSDLAVVEGELVDEDRPLVASTKLTPRVFKRIKTESRKGVPLNFAAALAGVHGSTAKRWFDEGQSDPEGPYGEFALAVQKAQAEFMLDLITEWREMGSQTKQWTALATMAERLFPDVFTKKDGKSSQVNVQVNVGVLEQRLHAIHTKDGNAYTGG